MRNDDRQLPDTITCPCCEADMKQSDNGDDWVCTENAEPTTPAQWEASEATGEDFCGNIDIAEWVSDMDEDSAVYGAESRS